MASNKQSTNKIPDWAGSGKPSGTKIDPGPFIGVIKNNVDPARQGRLSVWIPDIGGEENDSTKWYVVRYASPFFGSTLGLPNSVGNKDFAYSQQTYGFWAVPPDVGNLVLITFVMGDASRGYWFACVPNTQSQYMVPGTARPDGATKVNPDSVFGQGRIASNSYLPGSELNYHADKDDRDPEFFKLPRVVHTWQANIVINQGLDTDPVRGTITSSSQRETPSQVLGLSTPGRTSPDTADFSNLDALIKSGDLKISTVQSFPNRKGGHSLVMDDGDIRGDSQLVRLRTAAGHQILMHDTEDMIYISNSKGTAWVELTADGSVNIYSGASINLRASKDLNLHADSNVNIHAGDTVRMYAGSLIHSQTKNQILTADDLLNVNAGVVGIRSGGNMNVRSISGTWETAGLLNIKTGSMNITTGAEMLISSGATSGWKTTGELWYTGTYVHLNTSGKTVSTPAAPAEPSINPKLELYNQPNARFDNNLKKWYQVTKDFESVAPFTPTHEPWRRQSGALKLVNGQVVPPTRQNET